METSPWAARPRNRAGVRQQIGDRAQCDPDPGFLLGQVRGDTGPVRGGDEWESNSLNPSPSNWPNNPNRPVEKVSWDDVQIFLTRLNASEQAAGRLPSGWSYVLPTESQWEYACRAGTTTAYSWGATIAARMQIIQAVV